MRFLAATLALLAGAHIAPAASAEPAPVNVSFSDLERQAAAGDARAQRQAGLMLLDETIIGPRHAATAGAKGVQYLIEAARAGDDIALITLERRRRAGEPASPSLAEMASIEKARAANGDAMAAWRLAQRYQTGDGVEKSTGQMIRWLEVVARDDAGYPKARDAAYRLCEIYGRAEMTTANQSRARRWCQRAAGEGHAGAALAMARMRSGG